MILAVRLQIVANLQIGANTICLPQISTHICTKQGSRKGCSVLLSSNGTVQKRLIMMMMMMMMVLITVIAVISVRVLMVVLVLMMATAVTVI